MKEMMFIDVLKAIILPMVPPPSGRRRVPILCLLVGLVVACGGPGPTARSAGASLMIDRPRQGQVVTVRSLSVEVSVSGLGQYRLRYFLDGADQGQGDTTFTVTNLNPGNHRLEVDALREDGSRLSPDLRAGVDFVIQ
jgi:hypothetical protein